MGARGVKRRAALVLLLLMVGGALLLTSAHEAATSEAALPPIATIPVTILPVLFPHVSSVSPLAGAIDVPRNTLVRATFDRAIEGITSGSFYLETQSTFFPFFWVPVPANVSYNFFTHSATLNPTSDLQAGKTYRATLTSDIKSGLFHLYNAPVTWSFTTVSPPSVTGRTPSVGATDVPLDQVVSVSFDRAMNAATFTVANFNIKKTGGSALPAAINYSPATLTVTLAPSADLEPASTYVVTLNPGVLGANGLPVVGAPIVWSFTTVAAAPAVTGRNPTDGATGRPLDQVVSVSFDKDMDASTITTATFYIKKSGGTPLPAAVAYSAATHTATLTPLANLEEGSTYQVTLSTAVKGTNGLSVVGAPIVWSFSTVAAAPAVTGRNPTDGATGRPLDQVVSVSFDKDMDASTITTVTFFIQKSGGSPLPATAAYSAATHTATLTPSADLDANSTYQVTLSTAVKGTNGLSVVGAPVVWSFSTEAGAPVFSDVVLGVTPYATAIAELATRGIINGFPGGTFKPYQVVIRQQFAKMIVLTMGHEVPPGIVCPFTDVDLIPNPVDPLYPAKYVAVCALHGITTGKTATTFDPYSNIIRFQVISMVVRAVDGVSPGLLGTPPGGFIPTWSPGSSPQHGQNAARAEYHGLLAGLPLSSLDPFAPMPRGEVAQILSNLINLLEP